MGPNRSGSDINNFDMISKIETAFARAIEVSFSVAAFPDDARWTDKVIVGFNTAGEANDEYELLFNQFSQHACTLFIAVFEDVANLTLIDDESKDILNIKSLKLDREEFNFFENRVPKKKRFQFAVGCGGTVTLPARQKLFWVDKRVVKYELSQEPLQ
jgi:hypothetical protein